MFSLFMPKLLMKPAALTALEKLDMPKYNEEWHRQDIKDELKELQKAKGILSVWSEKSDLVYTYTRAKWSGHKNMIFPKGKLDFLIGLVYMFPKYTLRWLFFYIVGRRFNKNIKIAEVRNSFKQEKLKEIANKNGIDHVKFAAECEKLSKFWIFLK